LSIRIRPRDLSLRVDLVATIRQRETAMTRADGASGCAREQVRHCRSSRA
jgi:hypothetical protein